MWARDLRNFLVDNYDVEDLLMVSNDLKAIDQGYQDLGLETPEWVTDKLGEVAREVTIRIRSDLQRQLRAAKARREALATRDEKREKLDAQIAALEKQVSG